MLGMDLVEDWQELEAMETLIGMEVDIDMDMEEGMEAIIIDDSSLVNNIFITFHFIHYFILSLYIYLSFPHILNLYFTWLIQSNSKGFPFYFLAITLTIISLFSLHLFLHYLIILIFIIVLSTF